MYLLQLKMPPDQASRMADAIERDMAANPDHPDTTANGKTLVWLRYRVQRWQTNHETTPAS